MSDADGGGHTDSFEEKVRRGLTVLQTDIYITIYVLLYFWSSFSQPSSTRCSGHRKFVVGKISSKYVDRRAILTVYGLVSRENRVWSKMSCAICAVQTTGTGNKCAYWYTYTRTTFRALNLTAAWLCPIQNSAAGMKPSGQGAKSDDL